jgi:hypothetical protein
MAQRTARPHHLEIRVSSTELARIQREASKRHLTVSAYIRLALVGEVQHTEDRDQRIAGEVSRALRGHLDAALGQVVTAAADRSATEAVERMIDALVEGLGIVVATVTGRPVDDDWLDGLADRMAEAYHQAEGETDETDESTS